VRRITEVIQSRSSLRKRLDGQNSLRRNPGTAGIVGYVEVARGIMVRTEPSFWIA
jgi:hypothetical protein